MHVLRLKHSVLSTPELSGPLVVVVCSIIGKGERRETNEKKRRGSRVSSEENEEDGIGVA